MKRIARSLSILVVLVGTQGTTGPGLAAQVSEDDGVLTAATRHLRTSLEGPIAFDPRVACTLAERCGAPGRAAQWGDPWPDAEMGLVAAGLGGAAVRTKESVLACPASGTGCKMTGGIEHHVAFGTVSVDDGTARVRVYRISRRDPVAGSSILPLYYEYDATLVFTRSETGGWSFSREELVRVS